MTNTLLDHIRGNRRKSSPFEIGEHVKSHDLTGVAKLGAVAGDRIRLEHSRSLEDGERYRAMQTLFELGITGHLSDIDTYHGRARMDGEAANEWTIDPEFRNGGHESGNANFNRRTTLYTGTHDIATSMARVRARGQREKEEVYDVLSDDPNAGIIIQDGLVTPDLLGAEKYAQYHDAMSKLLPRVSEVPFSFEERHLIEQARKRAMELGITRSFVDLDSYKDETPAVKALLTRFNTRTALSISPGITVNAVLRKDDSVDTTINGKQAKVVIDPEYVYEFCHRAHIVGANQGINSATLSKKIQSVSLFDLDRVNTEAGYRKEKRTRSSVFGAMPQRMHELARTFRNEIEMFRNPYAKPEQLVEAAKSLAEGKYKGVFEADAGNWEGFTLEEHTETVLRNFDENYADKFPVDVLPYMRLLLTVHDIGKPIAAKYGEKHRQEVYNSHYAKQFLEDAGVDSKTTQLLVSILSEGARMASQSTLKGDESARTQLREVARQEIDKWQEGSGVIVPPVAYLQMVSALLICDGGAYTNRATTRRGKAIFRNHDSFGSSYEPTQTLRARRLRMSPSLRARL